MEKEPSADEVKDEQSVYDFKKLLDCSKVIDEIFHRRQMKVNAQRKAEEEKKKQEEKDNKEIAEANQTLKDTLACRTSTSKMTLNQQLSIDPNGILQDDMSHGPDQKK